MSVKKPHIALIGGGCAGLSSAAALVEKGFQVTVFESSPYLGGRARTVSTKTHDLDNGQHIFLGAYHQTIALLIKAGLSLEQAFLRLPLHINMQSTQGDVVFRLKSSHFLPAPLHLLSGVLSCKGLSWVDRFSVIKLMLYLKKTNYVLVQDLPLNDFLKAQKQSKKLINLLWEPLCLAALNTPIEIASSRTFLHVLGDSFSNNKSDSDFLLPRMDLSQIIAEPLARYIEDKGGAVLLGQTILNLHAKKNSLGEHEFDLNTSHSKHNFSHVVIATAPNHVAKLIQNLPLLDEISKVTKSYQYQPICTIYLQYAAHIQLPHVISGLNNCMGQWVFDRGQLCGQLGLISIVVSASGKHQQLTQQQLAISVAQELSLAFPQLPKPLWHKVISEKRATFSCNVMLTRPSNKTLQPNLYLAGDYTYANYPASIEGAIRSGLLCAELIAKGN